jgi:HK97 family phage major capsid protein
MATQTITLTKRLRKYAVKKLGLAVDASDADAEKLIGEKLASGDLSADKYAELIAKKSKKGKKDNPENRIKGLLGDLVTKAVKAAMPAQGSGDGQGAADAGDTNGGKKKKNKKNKGGVSPEDVNAIIQKSLQEELAKKGGSDGAQTQTLFMKAMSVADAYNQIRVKPAYEQYSDTKTRAICPKTTRMGSPHPYAGEEAVYGLDDGPHVPLFHPSDREKALISAYFKFALAAGSNPSDIPRGFRMTDHDRDLVNYAIHECAWSGIIHGDGDEAPSAIKVHRRKLSEFEVKALLDDSTSGGIEIAPIAFDDALVTTPVLYGELYPLVNLQNTTRGRRMKGGAVSNPTITSGVAEGTAIQVFNTSSFVTAFDTSIFTAVGSMEVGLDFEEDSPTNVGQIIVQKYGEKMMEWLDRVIAVGDGVTEPQGIFTSTATTVLNSDNGSNGGPTIGDYEALLFGVPKQFRSTKGSRNVFLANETTYRRARAIPVGPGDERRVFGMTHQDYMLLDRPYKIQNNISNNKYGFFNAGYFRMYKRLGMNIRIETAGNYLATKNLRLIVLRARYGGQLELGQSTAVILDGMN